MADLEELRKRLYKKEEQFAERMVPPELQRAPRSKSVLWKEETHMPRSNNSYFWYFVSFVVFLTALSWFFLFGPFSIFQTRNVVLEIMGDKAIRSGDKITWQVKATNKSGKDLEDVSVVFNFPDGAQPIGREKPDGVFRSKKNFGSMRAGESITENFEAYVFGGRDSVKTVSAVLEYRPQKSSAIFANDFEFSFSIARSPVSVSLDIPEELRMGQEVEFQIDYNSQSEERISDLFLLAALPPGFEYLSAVPVPDHALKNIWRIGNLDPAQSGSIKIKGIIQGSNLESKVFRAVLGVLDSAKKDVIPYDESSRAVVLREPFLRVAMSVGGQTEAVAAPGGEVNFDIFWQNNLDTEVRDAVLEVKLEGGAIDLKTVDVEKGSYREATKSILWNASSYAPFKNIAPRESGAFGFSFKLKNSLPLDSQSPRHVIKASANFKNGAPVAGFENVDLTGSSDLKIKASSRIQLVARGVYFNSVIPNTGPLPPKVGAETTYTVIWSLANMVNDIDNVVVKSALPPYVEFKEIVSPADANIVFNKNSGEIEWRVGRVAAGTGFLRPALQVSFQIGIIPSSDQIGSAPVLIKKSEAKARDIFTNTQLSSSDEDMTIDLPDDPSILFNQRKVVP